MWVVLFSKYALLHQHWDPKCTKAIWWKWLCEFPKWSCLQVWRSWLARLEDYLVGPSVYTDLSLYSYFPNRCWKIQEDAFPPTQSKESHYRYFLNHHKREEHNMAFLGSHWCQKHSRSSVKDTHISFMSCKWSSYSLPPLLIDLNITHLKASIKDVVSRVFVVDLYPLCVLMRSVS